MKIQGQIRDLNDMVKAIVTGLIGLIFLTALGPIVSPVIGSTVTNLGIFLIIISVIAAVISKIMRHLR